MQKSQKYLIKTKSDVENQIVWTGFVCGGRVEETLYYLNFIIEAHRDLVIVFACTFLITER